MFGRPRKYNNPEELQELIDEYFEDCERRDAPYTISGLAYALDIDRKTLLNYEKREGYEMFFPTIKRAKARIEQYNEEALQTRDKATAGVIFNLKNNFDWKDKQEIEADVKEEINIRVDLVD